MSDEQIGIPAPKGNEITETPVITNINNNTTEPIINEQKTDALKAKVKADNSMKNIIIEKVVVNIGVGEAGDKLIKAQKVIELLTQRKAVQTISQTTNRDFGIRKQMPIGCKVTLRGEPAEKFLERAFWVKDNRIPGYSFDLEGNFSFGIPDYTEFENMKYDPEIGIFGMDISVKMKRPGYRIARRRLLKRQIPKRNRITRDEVKKYIRSKFKIEVIE
jgi:large subunit ribosomal protein L5